VTPEIRNKKEQRKVEKKLKQVNTKPFGRTHSRATRKERKRKSQKSFA
jgi:hypothetical protein